MRIKLFALMFGISGILSWAFFHQVSKREALPEKIKLYAFSAPESTLTTYDSDYELVLEERNPATSSLEHKVDLMLRAIKENWGGIFVHSDVDMVSGHPAKETILKALEHTDIIVERVDDAGTIGSGFIACRANKKTLQLWETIKHMLVEQPSELTHDYLANLLHKNKIAKLRWDYAPSNTGQQDNSVA